MRLFLLTLIAMTFISANELFMTSYIASSHFDSREGSNEDYQKQTVKPPRSRGGYKV
jgi:hypothetical protein